MEAELEMGLQRVKSEKGRRGQRVRGEAVGLRG